MPYLIDKMDRTSESSFMKIEHVSSPSYYRKYFYLYSRDGYMPAMVEDYYKVTLDMELTEYPSSEITRLRQEIRWAMRLFLAPIRMTY